MTRTISVTVDVEFDGDGCGEGCYALNSVQLKKMYYYHECLKYGEKLASVRTDINEGIIYRCAECREEFGE